MKPLSLPARRFLAGLLCLPLFCALPGVGGTGESVPADQHASASTRAVLQYLTALPQKKEKKLISGQFVNGYPAVTLATVEKIHAEAGQWVALLGFDYYAPKSAKLVGLEERKPARWESVNPLIKAHWQAGGLSTINLHMTNPWTGQNAWDKTGNLAELLKADTPAGAYYHRQLAMIADGLADLQQAGVVVLFRPFHEVNGGWFWWGAKDPETTKQLWRALFRYLTDERKLHNLIWVYNSRTLLHYPGNDYADLTSFDLYHDDPAQAKTAYAEALTAGKPFALAEYGPGRATKVTAPLNYDYGPFAQRIQAALPGTVYFLCWAGPWGLDANPNVKALLNDPLVITRDDLKRELFSKLPSP
jgi:mannan endo-1,4-beta-mannosidase